MQIRRLRNGFYCCKANKQSLTLDIFAPNNKNQRPTGKEQNVALTKLEVEATLTISGGEKARSLAPFLFTVRRLLFGSASITRKLNGG